MLRTRWGTIPGSGGDSSTPGWPRFGGCLPSDIAPSLARAELGANQHGAFLREVDSINMRRRTRMVELATAACGGSLLGASIAGASVRRSSQVRRRATPPALNVAGYWVSNSTGRRVNVYDPKAMENSQRLFPR